MRETGSIWKVWRYVSNIKVTFWTKMKTFVISFIKSSNDHFSIIFFFPLIALILRASIHIFLCSPFWWIFFFVSVCFYFCSWIWSHSHNDRIIAASRTRNFFKMHSQDIQARWDSLTYVKYFLAVYDAFVDNIINSKLPYVTKRLDLINNRVGISLFKGKKTTSFNHRKYVYCRRISNFKIVGSRWKYHSGYRTQWYHQYDFVLIKPLYKENRKAIPTHF